MHIADFQQSNEKHSIRFKSQYAELVRKIRQKYSCPQEFFNKSRQ